MDDFSLEIHERLYKAFPEAARHKRRTYDEKRFEAALFENMELLYRDIMSGEYHPTPGIAFVVSDPVLREIFAAPFRDRVVHHFVVDDLLPYIDTRLSYDSYSCRKGKGNLMAIMRLKDNIRKVSHNYTRPVYVAKFDIQSFFMSLDRKRLVEKVDFWLKRQYPNGGPKYDLMKGLWKEILLDDPTVGVKKRGSVKNWIALPPNKSLFNQPEGRGIVIGNYTSQIVSNLYMDDFDRFVHFDLGYKHYGRYVDDYYIVVPEEDVERVKFDTILMEGKLAEMGLTLHPRKRSLQLADHGIEFLGTVVAPGRIIPGKRIMRNFRRTVIKYKYGHAKVEQLNSYEGLMCHYNSKKMMRRVYAHFGQR